MGDLVVEVTGDELGEEQVAGGKLVEDMGEELWGVEDAVLGGGHGAVLDCISRIAKIHVGVQGRGVVYSGSQSFSTWPRHDL